MQNKYTANSTPQTKRKLAETSPEFETMAKKPVGNMDVEELMYIMKTTMNTLLEEKLESLPTKKDIEDIKSGIASTNAELADLRAENSILKQEIEELRNSREEDANTIRWLEYQIKNTKLLFKGITFEKTAIDSVLKICTEKLHITPKILTAHTVAQYKGKQTIIAEFDSDMTVAQVLGATRNLIGTDVSVYRDLNPSRRRNKMKMLALKKQILQASKKHKVIVRDDKLKIMDKWFSWNSQNVLVSGNKPAEAILIDLYADEINTTIIEQMLNQARSKN